MIVLNSIILSKDFICHPLQIICVNVCVGGGPRVVVSTRCLSRQFGVRFPVSAVWKKQKMFLPHWRVRVNIVGSLRDREVACSASDRQGSNFESCVWRTVSSQSSHHPQEVLLAQFSLYVHKDGLKPDLSHFHICVFRPRSSTFVCLMEKSNLRSPDFLCPHI